MSAYCDMKDVALDEMRFLAGGARIRPDDTAESVSGRAPRPSRSRRFGLHYAPLQVQNYMLTENDVDSLVLSARFGK
jgi:hypothetical protein